jgi:hypothetical protein
MLFNRTVLLEIFSSHVDVSSDHNMQQFLHFYSVEQN